MNKLVEIVIHWSIHKIGFHSNIKKMYNSVNLVEDGCCLQLYIWQKDLDPRKLPEEKVIKTLICGAEPSGNQIEAYRKLQDYQLKNTFIKKLTNINQCLTNPANQCFTDIT